MEFSPSLSPTISFSTFGIGWIGFFFHIDGSQRVPVMERKTVKPIRGEKKQFIVHDPWGFGERISQQSDVQHFLSDSGELISQHVERQIAADCGCVNQPAGGICADCLSEGMSGLTCISCFHHCRCGKPICKSHTGVIAFEDSEEIKLCGQCFSSETRKIRLWKIKNFLLP